MKRISNILFFIAIFLIGIGCVYAADSSSPPVPNENSGVATMSGGPSPPGLAVDDKVLLLVLVALVFGLFKIYSFIFKKKRPV